MAKLERYGRGTSWYVSDARTCSMATDTPDERTPRVALVARLVAETGVSPHQAEDLVSLPEANWSSLVRVARLLARKS